MDQHGRSRLWARRSEIIDVDEAESNNACTWMDRDLTSTGEFDHCPEVACDGTESVAWLCTPRMSQEVFQMSQTQHRCALRYDGCLGTSCTYWDLQPLAKWPLCRQFIQSSFTLTVDILLCGIDLNFGQAYRGCFMVLQMTQLLSCSVVLVANNVADRTVEWVVLLTSPLNFLSGADAWAWRFRSSWWLGTAWPCSATQISYLDPTFIHSSRWRMVMMARSP